MVKNKEDSMGTLKTNRLFNIFFLQQMNTADHLEFKLAKIVIWELKKKICHRPLLMTTVQTVIKAKETHEKSVVMCTTIH